MVDIATWSELVRRAGSAAKARTWVQSGPWRRVLRDAYAPAAEDLSSPQVRAAALRRVLPADAAASHRTALWLLGDDVLRNGVLDVTGPRGRHYAARPGVRMHSADLPDSDLVVVGGVLSVSAARAVVDVSRAEPLEAAVAFGDRALRLGATTPERVADVLGRAVGLRGVRQAREATALLNGRSESWNESVLRVKLQVGGLSGLEAQFDAYDRNGHVGRGDLYLDGCWVEYDGRAARLVKEVFVAERRRQNALVELGLQVRRFTAPDLTERSPRSLVAEVLRAVAAAAGRDRELVRPGRDTLRPPRLTPLATLAEQVRAAA